MVSRQTHIPIQSLTRMLLNSSSYTRIANNSPDPVPAYDASGFYAQFGFQFVNPDPILPAPVPYRTMYLDLKPLMILLSGQEIEEASDS